MSTPKYRDTIGELLFRFIGGVMIVAGVFVAIASLSRKHNLPFDGSNLMMLGAASMIYSRLCQIARR